MQIHVQLNGEIVDLLGLTEDEFAFYEKCLSAYRESMKYAEYLKVIQDPTNPLMKGQTMMTKEIHYSPLGRVLWDLAYRLGIKQGEMVSSEGSLVDIEPAQPDLFKTVKEAAEILDISVISVYRAIKEHRLAGHQKDGRWWVSNRSIKQYSPDRKKQKAGLSRKTK